MGARQSLIRKLKYIYISDKGVPIPPDILERWMRLLQYSRQEIENELDRLTEESDYASLDEMRRELYGD